MGRPNCFRTGDIVESISGRDRDGYYVVIYSQNNLAGICDGKLHKIDKIKKKNLKHISPVGTVSQELKEKLENGRKVIDAEIRREIKNFKHK